MITFVNRFTLTGAPEEFEKAFDETAEFLRAQPGLIGYTLSRQLDDPASYVNIALWESADALRLRRSRQGDARLAESQGAIFGSASFEA